MDTRYITKSIGQVVLSVKKILIYKKNKTGYAIIKIRKFMSKIPDFERGKANPPPNFGGLTTPYDLPDLRVRREYKEWRIKLKSHFVQNVEPDILPMA